jgi:hypothetical protein
MPDGHGLTVPRQERHATVRGCWPKTFDSSSSAAGCAV